MLVRITVLILIFACSSVGFSQDAKLFDWKKLEVSKLKAKVDTVNEITFDTPVFTAKQKELAGKKVLLKGFLNVIEGKEGESNLYLLQRYDQSDYGPEYPLDAIVEVIFKKSPSKFKANDKRVVQGVLVLNDDDFMHPFYILEKAKLKK